uniref:Putative ovule protein n=1 Tax=Solanum chacoense TaxID=4108 RepID=A0A0V0HCL9_SOLCH
MELDQQPSRASFLECLRRRRLLLKKRRGSGVVSVVPDNAGGGVLRVSTKGEERERKVWSRWWRDGGGAGRPHGSIERIIKVKRTHYLKK